VHGIVTFTKVGNGIKTVADIEVLMPGKHSSYVYQYGDWCDPRGKSAGSHFNPEGVKRTGHNSSVRHAAGDFVILWLIKTVKYIWNLLMI